MTMDSTKPAVGSMQEEQFLCDDWFDPLESGVRTRIRGFIEELLEAWPEKPPIPGFPSDYGLALG
jgi:hypothetical protein